MNGLSLRFAAKNTLSSETGSIVASITSSKSDPGTRYIFINLGTSLSANRMVLQIPIMYRILIRFLSPQSPGRYPIRILTRFRELRKLRRATLAASSALYQFRGLCSSLP